MLSEPEIVQSSFQNIIFEQIQEQTKLCYESILSVLKEKCKNLGFLPKDIDNMFKWIAKENSIMIIKN
jgi:hypothetical protein